MQRSRKCVRPCTSLAFPHFLTFLKTLHGLRSERTSWGDLPNSIVLGGLWTNEKVKLSQWMRAGSKGAEARANAIVATLSRADTSKDASCTGGSYLRVVFPVSICWSIQVKACGMHLMYEDSRGLKYYTNCCYTCAT